MKIFFWNLGLRLLFGVAVVVVLAVWFGGKWYFSYHSQSQSHTFAGSISTVLSDGNITVKGVHVLDKNPAESDYAHPKTVTVIVTSDTKFTKTVLYMPTKEELLKSGGGWNPATLKREQQLGSEDDFKNTQGLPITVKTKEDSYGMDKAITAQEIGYHVQVYPK